MEGVKMLALLNKTQDLLDATRKLDFLGPLAIRFYLFVPFWMAGTRKWDSFESTAAWFGNPDWGLGLPFPTLMASLATGAEVFGAVALLIGLATRWFTIPLIITMLVAIFAVHWDFGWAAIASDSSEATTRLNGFMQWLQEKHPGRHSYITEFGRPVMLQNGVEFAATYLVMLIALFFTGAGRYTSIDYWIKRSFRKEQRS